MMLSTALTMMIAQTECVFFINTPDSIQPVDVINKTVSPWIYSELALTKLVRRKNLHEYRSKNFSNYTGNETIEEKLKVEYNVDLSHLTDLNMNDIIYTWLPEYKKARGENALDSLYTIKPDTRRTKLRG